MHKFTYENEVLDWAGRRLFVHDSVGRVTFPHIFQFRHQKLLFVPKMHTTVSTILFSFSPFCCSASYHIYSSNWWIWQKSSIQKNKYYRTFTSLDLPPKLLITQAVKLQTVAAVKTGREGFKVNTKLEWTTIITRKTTIVAPCFHRWQTTSCQWFWCRHTVTAIEWRISASAGWQPSKEAF